MQPVTIHIDFTQPGPRMGWTPLASLIQVVQGTRYSHVCLRWIDPHTGVECIYEASAAGVGFRGPISARGRYSVQRSYQFVITYQEYRQFSRFCHLQAGISYGTWQLLGIAIARLLRLRRNPLSSGTSMQVCSELVGYFVESVLGYDIPMDLDLAGPREIDEFLSTIQKPVYIRSSDKQGSK